MTIKKRELKDGNDNWLDYTNGNTCRSLSDFCWLEKALLAEYNGGLLLPSLAISLGVPDLENTQHEVDSRLLSDWFSDVMNGVRGQGGLSCHDLTVSNTYHVVTYSAQSLSIICR